MTGIIAQVCESEIAIFNGELKTRRRELGERRTRRTHAKSRTCDT
jgi:hypothetical protein